MRLGMLPSHKRALERAFRKAEKFDTFRARTRRTFVAGGLAAIAAAATSFWAGNQTGRAIPRGTAALTVHQAHARRIAAASDEALLRERLSLLQALEDATNDPVAWMGFRRLAGIAVATRDQALAKRLLVTWSMARPGAEVADLGDQLRTIVN